MILSDSFLNILATSLTVLFVLFVAVWISLIIWAYRDMRARSRDIFAQILTILVVALLPIIGILIYLILRPSETLVEAFERSLLEESLLQEIENKPHCPGCSRHVQNVWQICPYCHVKLKKHCDNCQELIEMQWTICPFCAEVQQVQPDPIAEPYNGYDSDRKEGFLEMDEDNPATWTIGE